jgi:nucleoside-diphosphate kinase
MERTLILVKPDAYRRGLCGEIMSRFERKNLRPIAARVLTMSYEMAGAHYAEHVDKPFFPGLAKSITSGPLLALVIEGPSAIAATRQLIGATDPLTAAAGTIRGDFGLESARNLVHGSDGPESAAREIAIFFPDMATGYADEEQIRAAQLV